MGTVLKVLGVLFIGYWLMVIVGCSMFVSAIQQSAKSAQRSNYDSSRKASEARRELSDQILREIEADRGYSGRDRSYSSYDRNAGERPHFKPGEPMVDPNP